MIGGCTEHPQAHEGQSHTFEQRRSRAIPRRGVSRGVGVSTVAVDGRVVT
jgi:hypothetical protein